MPIAARPPDDAHARLVWIAPAAILLSFAALYGFLRLTLERPAQPSISHPATVSVVMLPAAPAQRLQPAAPPQAAPPPEPAKPAEVVPPPLPEAVPLPKRPPLRRPRAEPPRQVQRAPEAPPPLAATEPTPPAAAPPATAKNVGPAGGNMSARAIYQPLPEIPEALRHQKMRLVAVARFRIGTDGKATVELIQPTPLPSLNSALLERLQTWRFFPATTDGRPVASVLDIRIPIAVR